MEKPVYPIRVAETGLWYEFDSVSEQKTIRKVVAFYISPANNDSAELVFGDLLTDGSIDVNVKSNNKDMAVILLTVVRVIYYFLELYPSKTVMFMGSTAARNRLYRALITKFLPEQMHIFEVFGLTFDNQLEPFSADKDYFSYQIGLRK